MSHSEPTAPKRSQWVVRWREDSTPHGDNERWLELPWLDDHDEALAACDRLLDEGHVVCLEEVLL